MRRTRRFGLLFATMFLALLLASGAALAAIIDGTDSADTIVGTANGDVIDGLGGNDHISGMAGADRIEGGDGADDLYGGDEFQSIAPDGGSNINGEIGADYIVGSSGADTLDGGPGADTILEGPWNDGAAEIIRAGDGDDFVQAASIPGKGETLISCGDGVDQAEVDQLDVVSSDCETVTVLDPAGEDGVDPGDGTVEEFAPEIPADELGEEIPENAQPPAGGGTVRSTRRDNFIRSVPPRGAGMRFMESMDPVYQRDWVGAGIYWADGNDRRLRFTAYVIHPALGSRVKYLGWGAIREYSDTFDYVYAGGKSFDGGRPVAVYAVATGTHGSWTRMSGYQYVWH